MLSGRYCVFVRRICTNRSGELKKRNTCCDLIESEFIFGLLINYLQRCSFVVIERRSMRLSVRWSKSALSDKIVKLLIVLRVWILRRWFDNMFLSNLNLLRVVFLMFCYFLIAPITVVYFSFVYNLRLFLHQSKLFPNIDYVCASLIFKCLLQINGVTHGYHCHKYPTEVTVWFS